MARKKGNFLRTEAFATISGHREAMDTLDPEKRNEIGAALKVAWLNAIFMGNVVFQTHAEEKSTNQNRGKEIVDWEKSGL